MKWTQAKFIAAGEGSIFILLHNYCEQVNERKMLPYNETFSYKQRLG